MTAGLLNTEINAFHVLTTLPEKSVVIDRYGIAWQRASDGWWIGAVEGSDCEETTSALCEYRALLLFIWAPKKGGAR